MSVTLIARLLERFRRVASVWRVALARAAGAAVGTGVRLAPGCDLAPGFAMPRRGAVEVGDGCVLEEGVLLRPYGGSVRIGHRVFIGPGSAIYGHGGVTIGDDALIAMHCRILSSNHTIAPVDTVISSQPDVPLPTAIGRDVWLGAGVTVLGGVTIGDGCIVGAGAVVTKDLPDYSIAVGVPARVTGRRPEKKHEARPARAGK